VTIDVRAACVNPADDKQFASAEFSEPVAIGYEVSGVVHELGPDTELGSGGGAAGDEVLAFLRDGHPGGKLALIP
jgi:NADPH2:quinone reductase